MPRRQPPVLALLGLAILATGLLLLPAACPSKPAGEGGGGLLLEEQPAGGDAGPEAPSEAGPEPGKPDSGVTDSGGADSGSTSGLDARPANPTCLAPARPAEARGVAVRRAFPKLTFSQPLYALQAPGDSSRVYVLEKGGRAWVFANAEEVGTRALFIDLSMRVNAEHNETGLLSMAFHPRFATNGEVFLFYSADDRGGKLHSYISRFRSTDGGSTLDPASEEVVLALERDYSYHNGGHLAFGPDGYLYIGFGDGGGREDPHRTAQNLQMWLGKLLRIDVDGARPYAIPPGNPFKNGGGREELYALGFRNPWRWSFDRLTGALWLGDVGEKRFEEVNRVVRGGNYGWSILEGARCVRSASCSTAGLTPPVATHDRGDAVSITGGYVYRGGAVPALAGQYVYGDFGSGTLWSLPATAMPGGGARPRRLLSTSLSISSFGELNDGELLVVDFGGGGLHRLVAESPAPDGEFPSLLSKTGCVDPEHPTRPAAGLIPYGVNATLWSDGAEKERFLAVPDGQTVTVGPSGTLDLPPGSVTVKTFSAGGRRLETRLFMRHPDGTWGGYSYEWNEEGTDAVLLESGKVKQVGSRTWSFPSRGECMQCHNATAGHVLGLEVAQLNGDFEYPGGRRAHQLQTLEHIGLLSLPSGVLPHMPAYDGPESLESRARAYLHVNCAVCHRPHGLGGGNADLRFSTPLAEMGVCNALPELGELGVPGARLLLPGQPGKSLVSLRMHARDAVRMPPLATREEDTGGAAVVDAWIASLAGCPEGG